MAIGAYLRRRWRFVGLVLVLLAGTTLFALMTDRGHEPQWSVDVADAAVTAVAPDGGRTYVAVTDGNGTVRDLVAYDARGDEAWRHRVPGNTSTVLLEASDGTVAVATEATSSTSGAHLQVLDAADGSLLLAERLQHTARALALDGRDVAVAVQVPPDHPVLVWRDLEAAGNVSRGERVMSLALAKGVLAVGTEPIAGTDGEGRIIVLNDTGGVLFESFRDYAVLQVRLDASGTLLAAAGRGPTMGRVEVYDLTDPVAPDVPRWDVETSGAVTHLDLAADGSRVLALVTPAGASSELRVYDTDGGGAVTWGVRAVGVVRRESTSTAAAADLSPDGRHVAYGTLTGGVNVYEVGTVAALWRYGAAETEALAFARGAPATLVATLSIITGGDDDVASFHLHEEPFVRDLRLFLPAVWVVGLAVAAAALAVGYVRRPTG